MPAGSFFRLVVLIDSHALFPLMEPRLAHKHSASLSDLYKYLVCLVILRH